MLLAELSSPLLQSLLLGSLFALMAVGLTLTFAVTRIINFAHAELVTTGAYVAVLAINLFQWGAVPALALAALVAALLAVAMDELVFKPLVAKRASALYMMVASIGVGIVLRHFVYIGADWAGWLNVKAQVLVSPVAFVGYAAVTDLHLWVLPSTIGLAVVLHLFLGKSRTGKAMRAVADNLALAKASGVWVNRVRRSSWVIAGGLAGLAGAFWAIYSPITPEVGWTLLLRIVAASILGGLTSIYGTIAGAYIVAFGENVGIFAGSWWLGVPLDYRSVITFLIVVVVLMVKPAGLAGVTLRGLLRSARDALGGLSSNRRFPGDTPPPENTSGKQ